MKNLKQYINRLIPTFVGNTRGYSVGAVKCPVNPHVRGEHGRGKKHPEKSTG